ncbi:hypothetical protein DPMN_113437 [Dreissena polymorpha]|uniref:Uncharacterized protein n=1 Tax=Dreissena polymorpha TaxID=45954 RepID=A0A9D4KJ27_DREPO|nr:hypothetical protein DPMN_113437 [Dreissena polymorpha]
MSEVGFRGDKPVEKSQTNQDLIDGETPAERPSIKNPIDVNSNNVKVPLNPAPRVVSRPLSLVQGVHVDEQNKTNMSVVVKCPSPSPRSRTPRTGSNIISKESNETSPGECPAARMFNSYSSRWWISQKAALYISKTSKSSSKIS